jgi:glycosyltransferase involved in cell wall biosynthesis
MKDEVNRVFGVPGDKVRVIPNGISGMWFDTPRAPASEPLVAFVGRTVAEKGPQTAVEAMLHVVDEFPEARLVVAGDGPMDAELGRRVYRAGLGKVVELAGRMDDARLRDLYSRAWVAVFPSSYEPFGIVALEAMAAGAPCVVGAAGGLPETVDHGRTGLVVEPDNPRDLAAAILSLFRDPVRAEEIAARARKVALAEYSWDDIAGKTMDVYGEVLRSVKLPASEVASAANGSQGPSCL